MLLESQLIGKVDKEKFSNMDSWDVGFYCVVGLYILWSILWIATIVDSIKMAKKNKGKNISAGLVLSVLSWPFYWIFKLSKAIG